MRVISCASRGRGDGNRQTLEMNSPDYANSLTSVRKDCMIAIVYESDDIRLLHQANLEEADERRGL